MEISTRSFWELVHGMGFGGLYLLACSAAIVELARHYSPRVKSPLTGGDVLFLRLWLIGMALIAWVTVITGAYVIYPWYRAVPPAGTVQVCPGAQSAWLEQYSVQVPAVQAKFPQLKVLAGRHVPSPSHVRVDLPEMASVQTACPQAELTG